MNLVEMIENMRPQVHSALKKAVEIGKWPNGEKLSQEQRALCMEAVLTYDQVHLAETERVGYIDRGIKEEGEMCGDDLNKGGTGAETPMKWIDK